MNNGAKKVLWISCVGEKGGAEVYMLNLFHHFDRNWIEPSVAMLRDGPLRQELQKASVPVHLFEKHRMRNIPTVASTIQGIVSLIRCEQYDIVHSNAFRAAVYGGIAAKICGVPHIWSVHTDEELYWYNKLILMIPVDLVLANCHRTADFFVKQKHPTCLFWPSVDPEQHQKFTSRLELEKRYDLPSKCRWICQGSRLQRYKGQRETIRLLAELSDSFDDVHAIIMGGMLFGAEINYLDELKAYAAMLKVEKRVHFTGHLDKTEDVNGILQGSELMVHPARDEDFGLIIAEAYLMSTPVVAY